MNLKTIGIAGTGNVSWSFYHYLKQSGFPISGVFSRKEKLPKWCANERHFLNLVELGNSCDVLFLFVPDSAIQELAYELKNVACIVCHSSGSTPIKVLEGIPKNGVFYPLQTFSLGTLPELKFPLFVEGSTEAVKNELEHMGREIGLKVIHLNSEQRVQLHASAVVACNFSNAMLAWAKDMLERNSISFDFLKPLIEQTFQKAIQAEHPKVVQTGPAKRGDALTMNNHIKSLKLQHPYEAMLYEHISKLIEQQKA